MHCCSQVEYPFNLRIQSLIEASIATAFQGSSLSLVYLYKLVLHPFLEQSIEIFLSFTSQHVCLILLHILMAN